MAFDFDRGKNTKGMSSGFQNRPGQRKHAPASPPSARPSYPRRDKGRRNRTGIYPSQRNSYRRTGFQVPWERLLPIIGILAVIAMLWICRDAITEFLSQILSWVVTLVVIVFIIKCFLFPRR